MELKNLNTKYLSRKFDKFNYYANTEDSVIINTVRNA